MEKNTIENKNKTPRLQSGNSSEDDLLASSQELVASQLSVVGSDTLHQTTTKTATLTVSEDGKTTQINKKSPADVRKGLYQKTKFILGKIAKNAANGTVHERDELDKIKYTKIVEEYEEAKTSRNDDRPTSSKRERSRTEDNKPAKRKKNTTLLPLQQ
ncbi:uncharacterized protein [Musca autumnalis]|uniref:uncharacterized protein n=1 Tax=Musca autumnalis TaxID=221902 RepID=UPI003CF47FC6